MIELNPEPRLDKSSRAEYDAMQFLEWASTTYLLIEQPERFLRIPRPRRCAFLAALNRYTCGHCDVDREGMKPRAFTRLVNSRRQVLDTYADLLHTLHNEDVQQVVDTYADLIHTLHDEETQQ